MTQHQDICIAYCGDGTSFNLIAGYPPTGGDILRSNLTFSLRQIQGFCQADKGKGGFVVVAYLLPFSAPLSADNSTIALFDVLVLKFLGLSGVLGEVVLCLCAN